MSKKKFKPRRDGICCRCKKRKSITSDGRFCGSCLRKIIFYMNPNTRSYIGSERLDRKDADVSCFNCELIDFDADCSLGGKPNNDSWFPFIDGQH
jgi:hypothetical protein